MQASDMFRKLLAYLSLILLLCYLLYILPHSGIDFADAGLTLYSSLSQVDHSIAYDWIALPRPSILTAFFMWLGIRNILLLKLSFALSLLVAIALLGMSINKRIWLALLIVAAIGIYNAPLTLASYENSPTIFLMSGLGFFFFAYNKHKVQLVILSLLASLFFVLSAFTNISVLPASIFAVLLLSFSNRKQAGYLIFGFVLFFSLVVYMYGSYIGFDNLCHIFASAHSLSLFSSILNKLHSIFPLYAYAHVVQWFPRMALLILLLSFLSVWDAINHKDTISVKLRLVFIIGLAYYCCQALMTDNPLLLPLSYYAALFSLVFLMAFYNEPMIDKKGINKETACLFYFLVLGLMAVGLYTQLNFSYGNGKTIDNNTRLSLPLLNGIYVTPQKAALLKKLNQIYFNENCSAKPFISFYDLPLLYYLFQRSAPLNQSWIESFGDAKGFPQSMASDDKILEWISANKSWCVFYSSGLTNKNNLAVSDPLDASSRYTITINYEGKKGNIWMESAPLYYEISIK
jgi:hypothetical protein